MRVVRTSLISVAIAAAAAVACGDDAASAPAFNLTGTWDATYSFSGFTVGSVIQLTQTGNTLTGTYVVAGGAPTGDATGTVSGDHVTFRFDQDPPCVGVFNGTGTISNAGTRITGSYTGSDCSGPLSPTFVANKR